MTTNKSGYNIDGLCLNNTHTKSLKVYEPIKYKVEWLLTNLTKRILAIAKQMRRFSSREIIESNFLDV